ncbi:MAG: DUF5916 domain-containing protein [Candidatus Cyclobacteriaceae bacterium M2_1C_046]
MNFHIRNYTPFHLKSKIKYLFFLLVSVVVASANTASAQSGIAVPKLENPIKFDGLVEADEWGNIDTLSFITHWPTYGSQSPFRTVYRIAYDETFIYFSAICYDDPELIQAPYFERDKWEMNQDQITLGLDTYNDNENNLVFVVTPTGSRVDVSFKNDAQGPAPLDQSWNSYWEAKISRHDDSWMTEVKIPFSSLRFQTGSDDKVTMGVIAYRYISRDRHMDIYPDVRADWGFWSFLKPSQAQDMTFEGVQNKRPWFTSPYLLAGTGYHYNNNPQTGENVKVKDKILDFGLDVQHALTDNLNMDLTYNTDFAQVEADNQVVNLTRFSLFFPERRRFFLERSSIFDFNYEGPNRLFYSRRIGLENGSMIPLWGGVRLTGRVGNNDIGFLNMQSQETDAVPSENYGVFRFRRKVSQTNSYVGGMMTSRIGTDGEYNMGYGVDGIIQIFENDYLKVNLANTYYSSDTLPAFADRSRVYLQWEKRAQVGLNYALSYSYVGESYEPGLGFEMRENYKSFGDRISYNWFPGEKINQVRQMQVSVNSSVYLSNENNEVESFLFAPTFLIEGKRANNITFGYSRFYDNVTDDFQLSAATIIPANEYVNQEISASYSSPPVNLFYYNSETTYGGFYGGKRFSFSLSPTYVMSKYLMISGTFNYNNIAFDTIPNYQAIIGRVRLTSALSVKWMMSAFIQYNSLSDISIINYRLRFNPKDGNDLYLVYNEVLNNKTNLVDTDVPVSQTRAILLKYIHTFHLGR